MSFPFLTLNVTHVKSFAGISPTPKIQTPVVVFQRQATPQIWAAVRGSLGNVHRSGTLLNSTNEKHLASLSASQLSTVDCTDMEIISQPQPSSPKDPGYSSTANGLEGSILFL